MNWLNKLERKYGRYAIGNLMKYIVIGNAIVFGMEMIGTTSVIADKLAFNAYAILRGEVWRLFTFIFYPPNWSPIFILFALYFYYMIGTALEHEWGSFKFNIYYLEFGKWLFKKVKTLAFFIFWHWLMFLDR